MIKRTVLQCSIQMRMKLWSSSRRHWLTCRHREKSVVVIIAVGSNDAGVDADVTKVNAGKTAIKDMEIKSKNAPHRAGLSLVPLFALILTSASMNATFFGIQSKLAIVTRDVVNRNNEEMQGIIEG